MVTVIFVHGAGDTAAAWKHAQRDLGVRSHALDLPGRGSQPFDLSQVTVDIAVQQAVATIEELTRGPLVVVAHSIGGALSPGLLTHLGGRIVHLVHVAAVAAPNGELPLAVASEEFARRLLASCDLDREAVRGTSFVEGPTPLPPGLRPMEDRLALAKADSLNLGCVPTWWPEQSPPVPRTFIQPRHDRLYPPEAQKRLAAAMGANVVVEVDGGHNIARTAPSALLPILQAIVAEHS